MKCYYHHQADAVALCKSCNRAVCPECAADVPPGTACKGRCESDVADLNTIIERSKTAYTKTGQAYRRSGVFTLIIGLLFVALGLLPLLVNENGGALFMAPIGAVFLLSSFFSFRSGKQITEVK